MKVNGKLCYRWRAVDHEGEVLEAVVAAKRDKVAGLKLLKRIIKKYGRPLKIVTDGLCSYSAAMKELGDGDRQEVGPRLNNRVASAVSTPGAGDAAVSKHEDAAKVQLSSRPVLQSFQSRAPSRPPVGLQAETLGRIGRVVRACSVDRCFREGASRHAQPNRRYFDYTTRTTCSRPGRPPGWRRSSRSARSR